MSVRSIVVSSVSFPIKYDIFCVLSNLFHLTFDCPDFQHMHNIFQLPQKCLPFLYREHTLNIGQDFHYRISVQVPGDGRSHPGRPQQRPEEVPVNPNQTINSSQPNQTRSPPPNQTAIYLDIIKLFILFIQLPRSSSKDRKKHAFNHKKSVF